MKEFKQLLRMSSFAAAFISAACTASPQGGATGGLLTASNDQEATGAHAMVTGPENRLAEFNKNLRAALTDIVGTDHPDYGVSCDFPDGAGPKHDFNCDQLDPSKDVDVTIHYTFIRDRKRLEALVVAWNKVQSTSAKGAGKVTVIIDTNVPAGDC